MTHRRAVLALAYLGLSACGGSGGGGGGGGGGGPTPVNLTNFQVASDIVGQSAATQATPNDGAGTGSPNQVGLHGPKGHDGNGSVLVFTGS